MLPESLILIIASYLKFSWNILPKVCKSLRDCTQILTHKQFCQTMYLIPTPKDNSKLIGLTSEKLSYIVDSMLSIEFSSPRLMEQFISLIKENFEDELIRITFFHTIALKMMKFPCFETFLTLFRSGIPIFFEFEFDYLYRFIIYILKKNGDYLVDLGHLANCLENPLEMVAI